MRRIKRLIAFLIAIIQLHKTHEEEYTGENLPFTLIDSLHKSSKQICPKPKICAKEKS